MKIKTLLILLLSIFLISCSNLSPKEQHDEREKINKMADNTIIELGNKTPEINGALKNAKGYAVVNMKLTKVPVIGVGGGPAVLVDLKTDEHIYLDVRRLDFGGGWGARSYKILIIINNKEILEDFKTGVWKFEFGGEASVGTIAADENSGALIKDIEAYILADGGVSATITVRAIHATVNKELTE
jgi:lipid-binding SYLF domain-containing protein